MTSSAIASGTTLQREAPVRHTWPLRNVPVGMIGPCAGWFHLDRDEDSVIVRPRDVLPRRCTIRPAAMFEHDRGFTDVMTVMGRLVFANGATQEQRYTPFTLDGRRRLEELFLPVEAMPDDDWPMSVARWTNYQAITKRLLKSAEVPWNGLSTEEIERLVTFGAWTEPIEGCVLHALTQWTHKLGSCVIEIGSFRGRSLAMLAVALRGAASDNKVISIDPHQEYPNNASHVRSALADWGELDRLVQYVGGSDEGSKLFRPGCASFVFVDGDHSYRQVMRDFDHYRDLLAPGGVMAFHDYGSGAHDGRTSDEHEVRCCVDEHVFGQRDFQPLLLAHSLFAFKKFKN